MQHFRKNEKCDVTEELEPIDTNMQYDFDYQVSMKCMIVLLKDYKNAPVSWKLYCKGTWQ